MRKERPRYEYALNICDATKDKILIQFLIAPVVPNRIVVDCEPGRVDGAAVLLECPGGKARAIVHVIRVKHQRNLLRAYKRKVDTKTWKRL